MPLPDPVILIPGLTATALVDAYPLPSERVWGSMPWEREPERIGFHPDNPAFEARQPSLVRPGPLFEVVYKNLVRALRHELAPTPDRPVPVFPFAYDWRRPFEETQDQLDRFIDEAIARTSLMRHYYRDGYERRRSVSLIGHSMGGLIIAGLLKRTGSRKPRVSRVVTLAAPFRGSLEAVVKLATGLGALGGDDAAEREVARVTPALYHLLPSYAGAIQATGGLPDSLFDMGAWQPSVLASIGTSVRQIGLDPSTPDAQARTLFASFLGTARAHRETLESFSLAEANLAPQSWLAVAGVDRPTRITLPIIRNKTVPSFDFRGAKQNDWPTGATTGDGTVCLAGAESAFLPRESLVCVTPEDFEDWAAQNGGLFRFHDMLPNMPMLHRLITRFLTGTPDRYGNTWGRPAPGVTDWRPALLDMERR